MRSGRALARVAADSDAFTRSGGSHAEPSEGDSSARRTGASGRVACRSQQQEIATIQTPKRGARRRWVARWQAGRQRSVRGRGSAIGAGAAPQGRRTGRQRAIEDHAAEAILQAGRGKPVASTSMRPDADAVAAALFAEASPLREATTRPRGGAAEQRRLRHSRPIRRSAAAARASRNKARFGSRSSWTGHRRSPRRCTRTANSSSIARLRRRRHAAGAGQTTPCRPLGASALRPRDVGLTMSLRDGGYECIGCRRGGTRPPALQPAFLASAIEAARRELRRSSCTSASARTCSRPASIAEAIGLRAEDDGRAGALLCQKVFCGLPPATTRSGSATPARGGSDTAKRLKLSRRETAPIPWRCCTRATPRPPTLDWTFPGHAPCRRGIRCAEHAGHRGTVASETPWRSRQRKQRIDEQLGAATSPTTRRKGERQTARSGRRHVADTSAAYCAPWRRGDGRSDRVRYCTRWQGSNAREVPTRRRWLKRRAHHARRSQSTRPETTAGQPARLLNAAIGGMSPAFYDASSPIHGKGARGYRTQCKTRAVRAAWAPLLVAFLDGGELGATFPRLRRDSFEQHGNPLGCLRVHATATTGSSPPCREAAGAAEWRRTPRQVPHRVRGLSAPRFGAAQP